MLVKLSEYNHWKHIYNSLTFRVNLIQGGCEIYHINGYNSVKFTEIQLKFEEVVAERHPQHLLWNHTKVFQTFDQNSYNAVIFHGMLHLLIK